MVVSRAWMSWYRCSRLESESRRLTMTDSRDANAKGTRPFRIQTYRRLIQWGFLVLTLWIGYRFSVFVEQLLQPGDDLVTRPPGVESFLPISSLMSLKYWLLTGVFSRVHPAGLNLFMVILLTGLFLKKGFCSWVCPVGLLSEYLAKIHLLLFRKRRDLPRWLDYPLRSLKYLIAFFFLHAVLVKMGVYDLESFINSPYNRIADIKMLFFFTEMSAFTFRVLLALLILSVAIRFFWCRFLCPYGALLGALSWFSPWKIRRNVESCTNCGMCTGACPSRIDVETQKAVLSDECHACLQCVDSCPMGEALSFSLPGRRARLARPAYACAIVLLFLLATVLGRATGYWHSNVQASEYRLFLQSQDAPVYNHLQGEVPERRK
jgi:polyferredoxin